MRTTTEAPSSLLHAQTELAARRMRTPSLSANAARNAGADRGRRRRWAPARDSLWRFASRHLTDGARVAILGAGNGDDLPLDRLALRGNPADLTASPAPRQDQT